MALGVLDQDPPPFFRQGPSAFSKLMVFSAAALFLMVADTRFQMLQPARTVLEAVLFPMQWLAQRPGLIAREAVLFVEKVQATDAVHTGLREQLRQQSTRAYQVEQLELENRRLRALLELRPTLPVTGTAAQVIYDAADPFTRKVIIDRGQAQGIKEGSSVIDEKGVLGQVTQVFVLSSEVTLITDRDHATPVLNVRTGARGVVYGDTSSHADAMKLIPTLMPLITSSRRAMTPSSSHGSQRPWRSFCRSATKQPMPPAVSPMITAPTGLPQMAATRWGTPGRNLDCSWGIRAPLAATTPVSSSRVVPTTTASSATVSSRNCQPFESSTGRK